MIFLEQGILVIHLLIKKLKKQKNTSKVTPIAVFMLQFSQQNSKRTKLDKMKYVLSSVRKGNTKLQMVTPIISFYCMVTIVRSL